MTFPLTLQTSAKHIKRAGIAQNKLAALTVSEARRKVKPHIEKVRKNILKQLAIRERDRKKGIKGSQAVYYKLKEIESVIEKEWPTITKSVRKTAATNIPIGAKNGFKLVNAELGTAYRTPLVAAAFADSVDLIVKTAAKVHKKVIRAEIVQGMIANDDFATSAARISGFFDKGKGTGHYKSPFANATRVIRSETQLAHVRAKVALYENEGYTRVLIVNGKVGCPICAPHIGEIYRLADDPLPIYHPHCGCSAVAFDRKPVPPENKIPESEPIPVKRETDFQKVPKFVPAKSKDEAEKRIMAKGVKFAKLNNMDQVFANNILHAVERAPVAVREKIAFIGDTSTLQKVTSFKAGRKASTYYGVSVDLLDVDPSKAGSKIPYIFNTGQKVVGINTRHFKTMENIAAAKKEINERYSKRFPGKKWFFHESGVTVSHHEIGHVAQNLIDKDKWKPIAEKWHRDSGIDMIKSTNEAWAEAYAAYQTGKIQDLPSDVAKFVNLEMKKMYARKPLPEHIKKVLEKTFK